MAAGRGVHRAADVEQANQHGQFLPGIQRQKFAAQRGVGEEDARITELSILLSISRTPRQDMQKWLASMTMAQAVGWVFSMIRSASCTTASSWICGRPMTQSTRARTWTGR